MHPKNYSHRSVHRVLIEWSTPGGQIVFLNIRQTEIPGTINELMEIQRRIVSGKFNMIQWSMNDLRDAVDEDVINNSMRDIRIDFLSLSFTQTPLANQTTERGKPTFERIVYDATYIYP